MSFFCHKSNTEVRQHQYTLSIERLPLTGWYMILPKWHQVVVVSIYWTEHQLTFFLYTFLYICPTIRLFNFLLQSTLHHANKPRNTGNEPCKQSQINSIMSHLHHASALESKTKVFVTLRKKNKGMKYLFPVPSPNPNPNCNTMS